MAFTDLPNEILLTVAEDLTRERDISHLTLVNRRCYHLLDEYLYLHNIKHRAADALLWAAENEREPTARKLLHLGADANVKSGEASGIGGRCHADITPLYWAALTGHHEMVKLLLNMGADPNPRGTKSLPPLFFAMVSRHQEVARTIADSMTQIRRRLMKQRNERPLSLMHVSCGLGLHRFTRYLLDIGASVSEPSGDGWTPLNYALEPSLLRQAWCLYFRDNRVTDNIDPDKVFETVKLLLEFGAERFFGKQRFTDSMEYLTARQVEETHPILRVRALFSDSESRVVRKPPQHKPNGYRSAPY